MGKRRFTQVSTSEDEEEPRRNGAGERRKGKKLRVEDEEKEPQSRGGDAAGGSSSGGGGGGGGGNRKEEEPPLEDAKPKGRVLRVSGKGKRKKRHYCSFEYDGSTFELEDPVLLTPEDKKQKPYVAIIKSAGRICWPDDAVPAITALGGATHETLGSDFQKYNQKMRQLDFNLKMGRKQEKKVASLNPRIYENTTLRDENTGKKNVDINSVLKMQHVQRLGTWAGGEARIPPLGAFFGACLAAEAEASGIPLDHSTFLCQRCETVLQPGFNCTIRIEKCVNKGRWHKKASVLCKNSVVYTCHFCSHRNLKWGTAEGHMKNLIASRLSQDSDSNQHWSAYRASGNSENVLAATHEVHQDVGEEIPLKLEPVSELKSLTPGKAAVTEEVSGSTPNRLPVGGNHSEITSSGMGTGVSSKRRRRAWSSLKEITIESELENARNLSSFAIPLRI
ncbi:uncharacterized protein LOC103705547 [Phoenix dactylifera]|uniref:Uncharacterized protein LOC103705547 n=1 Tax=Phoenix dactylifera TaxID=42345 RepID=A0A8B8J415_PHODC|nr:uncharacterized protein LOC103705547 [Phoenix dactylifera]